MYVRPNTSIESKEKLLNEWYRAELKKVMPALIEKWQPIVGKMAESWSIRKMKTRWGSCNIEQARILLNLDLAKKPIECLEYILVHELVHLRERRHNEAFRKHMDALIPQWRTCRNTLNKAPLGHEDWEY